MITFLPTDYQAPKMNSSYMKILPGENKIRILSKPVMGWEDWKDKKPIRFREHAKPLSPVDPEKPVKFFWSFIVWNYNEKQIQILHLTQASIRKNIEALCKDADWGQPFFYDIKILKKGEQMETEYVVNPLPHKPITEEMISCFHKKPINLEALYDNSDPFSHLQDNFTPGVFTQSKELELQPVAVEVQQIELEKLSDEQAKELVSIMEECDVDYRKQTWKFWKQQYKINVLADLPASVYEGIKNGALSRLNENAKKEYQGEKK
jgi:hypothetical protein